MTIRTSLLTALFFFLSIICIVAQAQTNEDLYEMSLEELMNVRIKRISLPNVPHVHAKGELMLAYHFMRMQMEGHYEGSRSLSDADILKRYMVTPTGMQMDMHMMHMMYGLSSRLTLMLMGNYNQSSMQHLMRTGMAFEVQSEGISDLFVGGLYSFYQKEKSRLTAQLGLRIPTGSVNAKSITPMSDPAAVRLPYPMQLGSGTFDPVVGITYLNVNPYSGWGVDVNEVIRSGKNQNDYRLGNEFKLTSWYSRTLTDFFSLSAQALFKRRGNIRGADDSLNPMMVYTAATNQQAGSWLQGGMVLTYHPRNFLKGIRLSVEGKYPIYQKLDGPQMGIKNEYKLAIAYVMGASK